MEAKLVVVGGDAQARHFELTLPAVIGRSRRTDVRLGHPLVSRQHCEVFEANGLLMVRDLGSLNGTFVGDTRIAEQATPVKPGELLTVGPITFRAEYLESGARHGKSSTWETQGPTSNEPLPDGPDQAPDAPSSNGAQGPMFLDGDEETARPDEPAQ